MVHINGPVVGILDPRPHSYLWFWCLFLLRANGHRGPTLSSEVFLFMLAKPPTWRILLLPRPLSRVGAGDGEDCRKLKGVKRAEWLQGASVHGALGGVFLMPGQSSSCCLFLSGKLRSLELTMFSVHKTTESSGTKCL